MTSSSRVLNAASQRRQSQLEEAKRLTQELSSLIAAVIFTAYHLTIERGCAVYFDDCAVRSFSTQKPCGWRCREAKG
jgi:hypothetical protein